LWVACYLLYDFLLPLRFPPPKLMIDIGASMAAPVFVWVFLRPILVKSNQNAVIRRQLRKLKYNKFLFDQLHNLAPKYELLPDQDSLILGT
jgi:hypothetical protein